MAHLFSPETTNDTKDFIQSCVKINHNIKLSDELDLKSRYKSFLHSWKLRRESTYTYRQHVGHFQAASRHKNLGWLLSQCGDIPIIISYSPKRHRKCINLMIFKKVRHLNYHPREFLVFLIQNSTIITDM